MAPYKVTYTGPGYTYTLSYPGSNTYTYDPYKPYGPDSVFDDAANTAFAVWAIAVGSLFPAQSNRRVPSLCRSVALLTPRRCLAR